MNDPVHGIHLAAVDHADQNGLFSAFVNAPAVDDGGAVVELADDLVGDLVGIFGDDLKADGASSVLGQLVRNGAGHKGIEDAQDHRLDAEIVHEVGHQSHRGIQAEDQVENVLLRLILMDQGSDEIGAAGVGAALDQQAVAAAPDDTCRQRSQNGAGTVFRHIVETGQVDLIQQQQSHGKHANVNHRADGQRLAHLEEHQDRQRDIDDQAQIAHADPENMLDHGADTVQTRRGELIGEDENLVIQRRDHGDDNDDRIGQNFLWKCHFTASGRGNDPNLSTGFLIYNYSIEDRQGQGRKSTNFRRSFFFRDSRFSHFLY